MRRELPPLLLALALAAAAAGVQLHGAWQAPGLVLPCSAAHPDCVALQWLLSWVDSLARAGEFSVLATTTGNYWPVGDRPMLGGDGTVFLLHLPFGSLWDWPASLLPFTTALVVANGLAGHLLARATGAGPAASLVAVAVLGLSPFAADELSAGRVGVALLAPLALFLAAWVRLLGAGGAPAPRRAAGALGAAALLVATAATYWYAAWFGVLAGSLLLLAHLAGARRETSAPPPLGTRLAGLVGPLALFAGAAVGLVAPLLAPYVGAWEAVPGVESLAFPSPRAATDRIVPGLWAAPGAGPSVLAGLLPLPALMLAAVAPALWTGGRRRALLGWGALALGALALGLGDLGSASPYRLVYGLHPALARFWWPVRHAGLLSLAVAVLAAHGLDGLIGRRAPGRRWLLAGAAVVGTAVCWRIQGAPLQVAHTPLRLDDAAWTHLAQAPAGAVISLPLSPAASSSNAPMLWQRVHRQPMLTGHSPWVARARPAAWDTFVADNTFLSAITDLEQGRQQGDRFSFTADDLAALQARGLRWVVLDRSLWVAPLTPHRQALDRAMDGLFGRPVARSADAQVWDLAGWTGETAVDAGGPAWPPALAPAGPEQPLAGRRPPGPLFGAPVGPRSPAGSPP